MPSASPGQGFLKQALTRTGIQPAHPVVSAVQFSAYANNPANGGGGTMNVHSGELHVSGMGGYAVGGVRSSLTHKRIPTQYVSTASGDVQPDTVLAQRGRVRRQRRNDPTAAVGVWHDRALPPAKRAQEWDGVEIEPDRDTGVSKAKRRGEKAIWDFDASDEIRTDR